MGRRPLPAARDLTRDGRWSTYDVSVLKKMEGKMRTDRTTSKAPASLAGRLAGPVFYCMYMSFLWFQQSQQGHLYLVSLGITKPLPPPLFCSRLVDRYLKTTWSGFSPSQGRYDNPIPPRCLAFIDCSKIPAHRYLLHIPRTNTRWRSVLRIRDVYPGFRIRLFSIPDPESEPSPSRIRIKEFKYFNPKKPKNGF